MTSVTCHAPEPLLDQDEVVRAMCLGLPRALEADDEGVLDRADDVGVDERVTLEVDLGRERPAGGVTQLEVDVAGPDEVAAQGSQVLSGGALVGDPVGRGYDRLELEVSEVVGRKAAGQIALRDGRVEVRVLTGG